MGASPDRPAPSGGDAEANHQADAGQSQDAAQGLKAEPKTAPPLLDVDAENEDGVAPDGKGEGHWYANADWWVAGFTGALFGATLGLWIFTWLLWGATKKAVNHASVSSQKELRAYIAVYPMGVAQLIGSTEALGQVRVQNVGRTPARNVTVIVQAAFGDRGRDDFPIKDAGQSDRSIQPGADLLQGSRDRLDVGKIMSGAGIYIFVWGEVRYRDIDDGPHFTRFRHRYHAASRNKDFVWRTPPKETRWIIDADKARYHTSGNDSN